MIAVSENAVKHLRELLESKNAAAGTGLRLLVKRGGCAGLEYAMKLDTPGEADQVYGEGGVQVIVDPESLSFLDGSEIDYSDSLSDGGFKVLNPQAERTCGCGSSFEPRKSDAPA
jgi:iron-sulfur cluster assembly accessory protein